MKIRLYALLSFFLATIFSAVAFTLAVIFALPLKTCTGGTFIIAFILLMVLFSACNASNDQE